MNEFSSLYIHIPFCVKKCEYCAFYSKPCTVQALDSYTEAMVRRIRSLPRQSLDTVYFGGGTPTVLGAERLALLLHEISAVCDIAGDAEINLEANPGTIDKNGFAVLRSAGFNRLSLGLQSADDSVLKTLGRIHDKSRFLQCYSDARKFFDNISVDIMFALPGDGTAETLRLVGDIKPEHVSAYSLILEEGTPLYRARDTLVFPDEDEEERQYFSICDALSSHGYEHYEISSWAKPGFRSRHNSRYWTRAPYLGLGPAAHSFMNGRRFSVPADTDGFISKSALPFLADTDYSASAVLSEAEAEEERVMLGLRLSDGVRLDPKLLSKAKSYADAGYGSLSGDIFSLNDRGFRVSNFIISELI